MSERTVEDIVLRSFQQFAGKSPQEGVTDEEAELAFELLNDTISNYNSSAQYIPFLSDIAFEMNVGIDEYLFAPTSPLVLLPNQQWVPSNLIIEIDFLNFEYTNILFPMEPVGKAQFYRQFKVTNFQSFPTIYFLEQQQDFSIVHIYPKPVAQFNGQAKLQCQLSALDKYTQIYQVPNKYFKLLRYELGKELVDFYRRTTWTQDHEKSLLEMRKLTTANNEWNSSIVTDGVLNTNIFGWQRAINGSVILGS